MSETKFTPGPWTAEPNKRTRGFSIVAHKCDWQLAGVSLVPTDISGGAKRNAQLIAAAPEMYAALKQYVVRGHHDTCQNALSAEYECNCGFALGVVALAKARGESHTTSATAPYTAPAEPATPPSTGERSRDDLERK